MSKKDSVKASNDVNTNKQGADEHSTEDLEELGNTGKTFPVRPRPIVRCYDAKAQLHQSKTTNEMECPPQESDCQGKFGKLRTSSQENAISSESIDRNVNYEGWLELKKRKWKETREKRKRQR